MEPGEITAPDEPDVDLDHDHEIDLDHDLDAIETDLADVEVALSRLELGTYWTCEVTGQELDDDLLEVRPTARRLAGH